MEPTPATDPQDIAPASTDQVDPAVPADAPAVTRPAPQSLAMDGCAGITSMTPLPESVVGAEPLPGWRGSPTTLAEIHLDGYVCERVAIDRFERGPVGLAFEFYAANGGPDACLDGSWTTSEVLHSVWVSDAEIAAHLSTLGLPARLAAFGLTSAPTASLVQTRLTIAADGGGVADLETPSLLDTSAAASGHVYRYLWLSPGGGVGFMDLDLDWQSDANAPPIVAATMPHPFLAAQSGSDLLVGYGSRVFDSTARGDIQRFTDPECEQPL